MVGSIGTRVWKDVKAGILAELAEFPGISFRDPPIVAEGEGGRKLCFAQGCGNPGGSCCSKCAVARYCSRECQRAHWKTHRHECARMTEASRRPSEFIVFDEEELRTNFRSCDLHARLAILSADEAFSNQPEVQAMIRILSGPLDLGMCHQAALNRDTYAASRNMLWRGADGEGPASWTRVHPMDVVGMVEGVIWLVADVECKLSAALFDYSSKVAELIMCREGDESEKLATCILSVAKAAEALLEGAGITSNLGVQLGTAGDRLSFSANAMAPTYARLAARCFRACAMLYERGVDKEELLKLQEEESNNPQFSVHAETTMKDFAEGIQECVGANAYNLGNLYYNGKMHGEGLYGTSYSDSYATAAQKAMCMFFLEKGSDHGDCNAQYSLGKILRSQALALARERGGGGRADIEQAILLYHLAADNPNPDPNSFTDACFCLGCEYMFPQSPVRDVDVAVHYWRKGAEASQIPASHGKTRCMVAMNHILKGDDPNDYMLQISTGEYAIKIVRP